MPFVYRDGDGHIQAVYEQPVEGGEEVSADDPALKAFVQRNLPTAGLQDDFVQSDLALARVMEDLIEILIDKKVIMFTDFPEGAQQKLLARRGLRKEFSYVEDLFVSDEDFDDGDDGNSTNNLF